MSKKRIASLLSVLLLIAMSATAFALPDPETGYYPRGGRLTLSPRKETTNSYAFMPLRKADNRVYLDIMDAYAESCGTNVSVQLFIVNEWGNWIAYGEPQVITLTCVPTTFHLDFSIRETAGFCVVVSAYGTEGACVMPYQVITG